MTRAVETTTPSTTLQAAALQMREASVGLLPVLEHGRPVGVVTDRDIAVRGAANGVDPKRGTVSEVMTRAVAACSEDDSTDEAFRLMEERMVRRLLVLDAEGRMTGLISLDDLSTLPAEDEAGSATELRGTGARARAVVR